MKTGETLTVSSREEFRNWLARYHKTKKEIWLVYYYKLTGRQTVSYGESVEEAICYGWIDSQQNRVDDKRFVRRFSPRRRGSHWSKYNKERALKMLREGKMKQSGMAVLPGDVLEAWKQREGTKSSSVGA